VDAVVIREGKNLKGRALAFVISTLGKAPGPAWARVCGPGSCPGATPGPIPDA
jgi:hypothetical protein